VTFVFRLSSSRFPAESGVGAALFGGRWNRIGTEAIYASESRSLAALEILVHFNVLPRDFVLTQIHIPDEVGILRLELSDLPAGWDGETIADVTRGYRRTLGAGRAIRRTVDSVDHHSGRAKFRHQSGPFGLPNYRVHISVAFQVRFPAKVRAI
jgi:hypothetical protein